ncbi:MAG: formylglycine-generating enzyme family protein [Treponema sp.]|jgi:formylglycine-generating enzyme required for sulfatase activity|nr:formylglycine-generating enzyme family protein [Treponema sp.]
MKANRGYVFFFLCALPVLALSLEPAKFFPKMIHINGGSFYRGSNEGAFRVNERVHEATVKPFLLSETEVTQDLYAAVMNHNPSYFKGAELPVESVSWFDAVLFCNSLSELNGLKPAYTVEGETVTWDRDSKGFRLPTEAEWEYAARGGQNAGGEILEKAGYSGGSAAADLGWYSANANRRPQPVKTKLPNQLGLYDMSGNVWEWCWDWYDDYPAEPIYDPVGSPQGRNRVFRGGAWVTPVNQLRVTFRVGNPPSSKAYSVGFRIAQNW